MFANVRSIGPAVGNVPAAVSPLSTASSLAGDMSAAIDDVKKVAIPVLRHRVSTNFQAQAEGKTSEDVIQKLLETVQPPEIGKYDKKRK